MGAAFERCASDMGSGDVRDVAAWIGAPSRSPIGGHASGAPRSPVRATRRLGLGEPRRRCGCVVPVRVLIMNGRRRKVNVVGGDGSGQRAHRNTRRQHLAHHHHITVTNALSGLQTDHYVGIAVFQCLNGMGRGELANVRPPTEYRDRPRGDVNILLMRLAARRT